ncbi:hypothetical protein PMH09_19535 [Roseofilum sp. BLCC_M143]|uniref:Uncharacterized protein n=1 Tax=Roseofilum casamattae BLCC-M143 TaxID=3022442 RepID=A0ABT7C1R2_9CYAN|nr:hypothetical protein [Roseofilum casamattae]MDJ1185383.1 hypothetical protein [Roseofilum casamattae BLCC-M143]
MPHSNSNDSSATVNITTDWAIDFRANGSDSLSKLWSRQAIAG